VHTYLAPYANGNAYEYSDIDLALVSDDLDGCCTAFLDYGSILKFISSLSLSFSSATYF